MEEGVARSSGGGGCEVRRIHIIYFLSHRGGKMEHPHLLRVHHLHRNGVYLRDFKRWVSDLRGNDMPEAFAWSYKRIYKNGYVWQDLLDDDLIVPISDNEYVLKGSQIIIPKTALSSHFDCKRKSMSKEDHSRLQQVEVDGMQPQRTPAVEATSETYEESQVFGSDKSAVTEDSMRNDQCVAEVNKESPGRGDEFEDHSSSSFHAGLLDKKSKKKGNKSKNFDSMGSNTSFLQESPIRKSNSSKKGNSMGASNRFRNFIACRTVNTNDAVLTSITRDNKASDANNKSNSSSHNNNNNDENSSNRNCNQHKNKSCGRSFESKKQRQQKENGSRDQKLVSAAYKPVGGPTCSQCGKIFKPEKMHSHMTSCSGMKAMAKTGRLSIEKKTQLQRQDDSLYEECNSGYFLTN